MKILITGIDGFLGGEIAARLIRDGREVVGISNGSPDCVKCPFFFVDITEKRAVDRVFSEVKPELCIHLAALAHIDAEVVDEAQARRVNVDGAINVVDAAVAAGCKKLIFFSSAKVYGDKTSASGIDESAEPNPQDLYAVMKIQVEKELLERARHNVLEVAIIRPVPVLGAGDIKGNFAKLIRVAQKGFFPLIDGGQAKRSIVFCDRVAERVSIMINRGFDSGVVYVFSDGAFELREILAAVESATGFVWRPTVPGWIAKGTGQLIDWCWKVATGKRGPVSAVVRRLTENFVVSGLGFNERYGSTLPELDMRSAMATLCREGEYRT